MDLIPALSQFPAHHRIATNIVNLLAQDKPVLGVYLGGSFAHGQPDRYSDLDFGLLVEAEAREQIKADHAVLRAQVGELFSEFPALHLGDSNLIIALYRDDYPVHVDYQYRTQEELTPQSKDKDALVLVDRTGALAHWKMRCASAADSYAPAPPALQYFEDRFWTWCIYTDSKIKRGELWEARDAIEFLRSNVLLRLTYYRYNLRYEGNRRVERKFPEGTVRLLEATLPAGHSQKAYADALASAASSYILLMDDIARFYNAPVQPRDRAYFLSLLNA